MKKIIATIMGIAFAFAMVSFVCVNNVNDAHKFEEMDDYTVMMAASERASEDRGEEVQDLRIVERMNDENYGGKAVLVNYYTADGSNYYTAYSLKALERYI